MPEYLYWSLNIDGSDHGRVFIVWVSVPGKWAMARAERREGPGNLRTLAILFGPRTIAMGPADRQVVQGMKNIDTGELSTWTLTAPSLGA